MSDQEQPVSNEQSKQENTVTDQDKSNTVDTSDLVHKDAIKEWMLKYNESEQARAALKSELSKVRSLSLTEEEYQSWKDSKEKAAKAAADRKKKEGKWEQLFEEKDREWTEKFNTLKSSYDTKLQEETQRRVQLESELHQRLVQGQIRAMMSENCAEDVLDIAVKDIIDGPNYKVTLDEDRNLTVIDKKTKTQLWGQTGPIQVKEFISSYLESKPSFKKAKVQLGSDTGKSVLSIPPPVTKPKSPDGSIGIADFANTAPGLELIAKGIVEQGIVPKMPG